MAVQKGETMKKTATKKLVAMVAFAAVLAMSLTMLVACGGGSDSKSGSDSGKAASTPAAQSDEDLIKADIEKVVGTTVSAKDLAEGFKADEDFVQIAEMASLDLDKYAEKIATRFSAVVKDVKVDGDNAVAKLEVTSPDFKAMYELLDKKLEEALADVDVANITEEEYGKMVGQLMLDVFDDPEFPNATAECDVDYAKKDGEWSIVDPSVLENELKKAFLNF